jgi:hypothetical protein
LVIFLKYLERSDFTYLFCRRKYFSREMMPTTDV